MAKRKNKKLDEKTKIFEDLEDFHDFCRLFGYKFNQSNLYNKYSFIYTQYTLYKDGKPFKDRFGDDLAYLHRKR